MLTKRSTLLLVLKPNYFSKRNYQSFNSFFLAKNVIFDVTKEEPSPNSRAKVVGAPPQKDIEESIRKTKFESTDIDKENRGLLDKEYMYNAWDQGKSFEEIQKKKKHMEHMKKKADYMSPKELAASGGSKESTKPQI
ncbi:hypothetical protein ABK040_009563 [Willaertia magna]